ncbi:MAG TPA: G1 family glutamic endopeptidase [Acidimicrobiales bacterium]
MTFNANGGVGTMAPETSSGAATLSMNTLANSGFAFSGWNTSANGSGTSYANGATYAFTASTMLYAQWTTLPSFTVTFNANGGTGTMAPQTSNVAEPLTASSYSNGTEDFVRWNTSANGSGTSYANGATYAFTASTMLYAQWAPTFTVTFNANGGTGTMAPQTSDVAEPLVSNTFSNGSLNFLHWTTNADGSGTIYGNDATFPFSSSLTLYAQWTPNSAPVIVQQPASRSVPQDTTTSFSATASGTPTPTVQWQVSTNGGVSWSSIMSATADTYTVEAVTTGYEYEAVFTNSVSSVTSLPAQLTALSYSYNWAGYALNNGTFNAVSGSWIVPSVSCSSPSDFYASQWVGIDGNDPGDPYVIQDGTSSDCAGTTAVYGAWYEFLNDASIDNGFADPLPTTTYPVAPGDAMSASVSYAANAWTFTLVNSTEHWTFSRAATEPSPPPAQSSAEWIVEAPELYEGGSYVESSVADFDPVTFTNASAIENGTATSLIGLSGVADVAVNTASTVLTSPGPLSGQGSSFTVTWYQSS